MKIAIILGLSCSLLFGDKLGLEDLLSEYRDTKELYKETKEEKAGHLILFSRADLDKMQAYTLDDVLKTIRMFTIKSTKFGMSSLVKSPYSEQSMSVIKLYINSYEINSITSGTGLAQYGKMGLNFIDHIEVYQAANIVTASGEPGSMIIKMYTKDPSRENATVVQASVDTNGGVRTQAIEADTFNGYSYLANIDMSKNKYHKYQLNSGNELSKDGERGQFYLNIGKKDDFEIELGSATENDDLFAGFGSAMRGGEMNMKSYYGQFTKYFNNDLKLILSSSYESIKITDYDDIGFRLFDNSLSKNILIKNGSYANNAILEKGYRYGNNNFTFGSQAKLKKFFLDEFKSNGSDKIADLGPQSVNLYSLYLEDSYDINENHQITLGSKMDHYDRDGCSSTENTFRFAYVGALSENFTLKSFIQKGYSYPIFAQTTFTPIYKPSPELKNLDTVVKKVELEYHKEALTLTLSGGSLRSKNGIVYNQNKNMFVNNTQSSDFEQFYINTKYRFDADNKIVVEYFKTFKDNAHFSPDKGLLIQLYNRVGKFDIYNELIYRSSYVGMDTVAMDAGYDYSAGAIYNYNKNIDIKLKGENIFDRASQGSIYGIKVPALERRGILTLEYIF